jgi:YlmC/YmxH family sporulation protein
MDDIHIDILLEKRGMLMMIKISDLRDREIINTNDGKRLGPIKDIELDLDQGYIKALVLPGMNGGRVLGIFGRNDEMVIPWEKIVRIGVDVILVDAPTQQLEYPKNNFK